MHIKMKSFKIKTKYFLMDILFGFWCLLLMLFIPEDINYLPQIGYILVPLSLYMVYKARRNSNLMFLLLIIALVNISIGVNDFIKMGQEVSIWQLYRMRMTIYNLMTAKALMIFNVTLNFFIIGQLCNEDLNFKGLHNVTKQRINCNIISIACLFSLIAILGYGIQNEIKNHIIGYYTSVESPIFEYSILIYILGWLTCKDNKMLNLLFDVYALLFIIIFLVVGDRSSASMYIIFLFLSKYKGKLKFSNALLITIGGIIFLNLISITRSQGIPSIEELLGQIYEKGIYSDTASWAYYSSITVIAVGEAFNKPLDMFQGFVFSVFGLQSDYGSLQVFAKEYNSYLFQNSGGCIFPSYFVVWLGYFGAIIAGIIIGCLIQKLFKKVEGVYLYFKLLMMVFSIRWYVYTPTNLFRSVFFIGGLVYMLFILSSKLLVKRIPDGKSI